MPAEEDEPAAGKPTAKPLAATAVVTETASRSLQPITGLDIPRPSNPAEASVVPPLTGEEDSLAENTRAELQAQLALLAAQLAELAQTDVEHIMNDEHQHLALEKVAEPPRTVQPQKVDEPLSEEDSDDDDDMEEVI